MKYRITLSFLIVLLVICAKSQEHHQTYIPETDPLVLEKLEQWQDLKFGLLMHWGPYSQWGIVESWSICPEDYGWCQRKKEGTPGTYFEYVKAYEDLQKTFNPTKFDPEKWANAAQEAGMKYVVFTTKHHDGFSMFDTKYTDYKITDPKTPFHSNSKSNITKEIFDAFRNVGLWAGAYFSKPDWHNNDYWWPYFPPKDRNVNYDPEVYPKKWEAFTEFTHNQILELLTDYGKVDILWLDGGWVAKQAKAEIDNFYDNRLKDNNSGFMKGTIVNQDIKMDELVVKARKKQPGLIVVDRAVEGKNQNYLTPENRVPDKELPYPWESCIIAGGGWSYTPNAKYMSGKDAIHMLVDIVCKGGNLLLNIAPSPEGTWDKGAYELLKEMGQWMDVNSEAIYGTRAMAPYKEGDICFTKKKDTDEIYAILLLENDVIPEYITLESIPPKSGLQIEILGNNQVCSWEEHNGGIRFYIPEKVRNANIEHAISFKLRITRK